MDVGAVEFAHPIEAIVGNLIPVSLGPVLMQSSMPMWMIWFSLALWHSTEGHSGYRFPWSLWSGLIPGIDGSRHDFHHVFAIYLAM
jgi:sterol desaturase/sphingolipid hydroxylase (fatty acid hydroxylase superfamily)